MPYNKQAFQKTLGDKLNDKSKRERNFVNDLAPEKVGNGSGVKGDDGMKKKMG